MLKKRSFMKMGVLRYVLGLWIAASLFFWGNAGAGIVDRIVVIVNDDIILLSELNHSLSLIRASLKEQGYPAAEQNRILKEQRSHLLEKLIYDKLTDQQVRRYHLKVKDADVDATIKRIIDVNKLTEKELRGALELEGIGYDEYRKQIRDKILRARLVNREINSRIVITDEDIKSYFDDHFEQYGGRTKYELRHILLRLPPSTNQAEKERVKDQINLIHNRLVAGEPFEKLAELFSEAPTASQGGHLGVFGTHLLTKEILAALKGLQEKQFSTVVETDQGYQIFYIEKIINEGGKTLEQARPEIYEKLHAEAIDRKFNTWIEDLRKRSHIQILD